MSTPATFKLEMVYFPNEDPFQPSPLCLTDPVSLLDSQQSASDGRPGREHEIRWHTLLVFLISWRIRAHRETADHCGLLQMLTCAPLTDLIAQRVLVCATNKHTQPLCLWPMCLLIPRRKKERGKINVVCFTHHCKVMKVIHYTSPLPKHFTLPSSALNQTIY